LLCNAPGKFYLRNPFAVRFFSASFVRVLLGSSKKKHLNLYLLSGAVALAEFIAESPRLLRLDLRGNHIRTGGLMALTLSLKVNQSVTRLDLDQEPKKEAVSIFCCMRQIYRSMFRWKLLEMGSVCI
jgi:hypothetical protein